MEDFFHIHKSSVVGLFMTHLRRWMQLGRVMVECTLSITHCLRLNLQLHTIDLVRTCRISSFCTVAWQLARFQLTRRIARSVGDSWASCTLNCDAAMLVECDVNVLSSPTHCVSHRQQLVAVYTTPLRQEVTFSYYTDLTVANDR